MLEVGTKEENSVQKLELEPDLRTGSGQNVTAPQHCHLSSTLITLICLTLLCSLPKKCVADGLSVLTEVDSFGPLHSRAIARHVQNARRAAAGAL